MKAAVTNPNCPPDALRFAVTRGLLHVRTHVNHPTTDAALEAIGNPNCPPDVLTVVYRHDPRVPDRVRCGVASNLNCPPDVLREIVGHADRHLVAYSMGQPLDRLVAAAIGNPNCPPDVLQSVAEQHDTLTVLRMIAGHPNLPQPTINGLLQHPDLSVQWEAALNPSLVGPPLHHWLAAHRSHPRVRTVVEDRATPAAVINQFVTPSAGPDVHESAVTNPNCPPAALDVIAESGKWAHIRKAVAAHPNATWMTLRRLAEDERPTVRDTARRTLRDRSSR